MVTYLVGMGLSFPMAIDFFYGILIPRHFFQVSYNYIIILTIELNSATICTYKGGAIIIKNNYFK